VFESLTSSITRAIDRIRMRGKLSRENIEQGMREVRTALLEADVNFKVVKQFLAAVTEKAVGEEVVKSVDPSQQIVKVVHDELVELMGPGDSSLDFAPSGATVILLAGLQGSGKTTTCGKLGRMLNARGRHPLLVAADVQRPAAIDQLETLGKQVSLPVYSERGGALPPDICKRALEEARKRACDTVILDTAGRLHIDEQMMQEVAEVAAVTGPREVVLVADAMTGQDAATSAKAFSERLQLTGVILTKLDGDARGGAALSVRQVAGVPIKFVCVGEKLDQIEEFYPERMADRILGMGDVVSLVEKAQAAIDQEEAQRLAGKLMGGGFTLQDFLQQLRQVKKMGSVKDLVGMIPGLATAPGADQIDDRQFAHMEALISSMTPDERAHPEIVRGGRKRRISSGAGRPPQEVNLLLKQFRQMKKMFGRMGRFGGLEKLMGQMPAPEGVAGGEAGAPGGLGGFLPSDLFSRRKKHGKGARKKKRKKKRR
jgi:signal recognition particle subunit SRP54